MDGRMDSWMDAWMDGWIDKHIKRNIRYYISPVKKDFIIENKISKNKNTWMLAYNT